MKSLKTSDHSRRWNPVKLPNKITCSSVNWNLPVLRSDFWVASIHYLTITAKQLTTLKPTFPFSAVKPSGAPLLYHTPEHHHFTEKLNPWYFLKLPFKHPCDKAPWNHSPLNSEPSHLLLLPSAISFTCRLHLNHFLEKKRDLHMQIEAWEKCFWIRLVSMIPNTHHCQQVISSGVLLVGEGGSSGNTRLQINLKGITSPLLSNSYFEHTLRRHSHWTDNAETPGHEAIQSPAPHTLLPALQWHESWVRWISHVGDLAYYLVACGHVLTLQD